MDWRLWLPVAASVAVYARAIEAKFVYDDAFAIVSNPDVAGSSPIQSLFLNDFWGQSMASPTSHKSYRPLTIAYFRGLAALGRWLGLGGADPHLFHAVGLALHALTTAQVHGASLAPFFASLAFALHPIHTEAVAGAVGNAEILGCLLALAAVRVYLASRDSWGARAPPGPRALALLLSACSLAFLAALAKEPAVSCLGSAGVLDWLLPPSQAGVDRLVLARRRSTGDRRERSARGGGSEGEGEGEGSPGAARGRGTDADRDLGRTPGGEGLVPGRSAAAFALAARALAAIGTLAAYVRLRDVVSSSGQLVTIQRSVENPIQFASTRTARTLSTLHLHWQYAWLLVWPRRLSADWSYRCVELISSPGDARNLCSLALYVALALSLRAARPLRTPAFLARADPRGDGDGGDPGDGGTGRAETPRAPPPPLDLGRLLAAITWALLVVPFFPASNVPFYVGTYIGERLLYLPSVGFCTLAGMFAAWIWHGEGSRDSYPRTGADVRSPSHAGGGRGSGAGGRGAGAGDAAGGDGAIRDGSAAPRGLTSGTTLRRLPARDPPPRRGAGVADPSGLGRPREGAPSPSSRCPPRAPASPAPIARLAGRSLVLLALAAAAARTYTRTLDWRSDRELFAAARRVCPGSAKVAVNLGILDRADGEWDSSLAELRRARELIPGYCEPRAQEGHTLLARAVEGIKASELLREMAGGATVSAAAPGGAFELLAAEPSVVRRAARVLAARDGADGPRAGAPSGPVDARALEALVARAGGPGGAALAARAEAERVGRDLVGAREALGEALSCPTSAGSALAGLLGVHKVLSSSGSAADRARAEESWGAVLAREELSRFDEALAHFERAAVGLAREGLVDEARGALERAGQALRGARPSPGPDRDRPARAAASAASMRPLADCLAARASVVVALAEAVRESGKAASPELTRELYAYLGRIGLRPQGAGNPDTSGAGNDVVWLDDPALAARARARGDRASPPGRPRADPPALACPVSSQHHAELINAAQSASPYDPWLHLAWADALEADRKGGREAEAAAHVQAAVRLLAQRLDRPDGGSPSRGAEDGATASAGSPPPPSAPPAPPLVAPDGAEDADPSMALSRLLGVLSRPPPRRAPLRVVCRATLQWCHVAGDLRHGHGDSATALWLVEHQRACRDRWARLGCLEQDVLD